MIWKPRKTAYDMVVLDASAMVESLVESQFTEQLDSLLNIGVTHLDVDPHITYYPHCAG